MLEDERKVDQDLMIEHPQRIVNIDGLAQFLKSTRSRQRTLWRNYPHFFVGLGTDLKAARFDIMDVLVYLKMNKGVGYEVARESKGGKLEVQVMKHVDCRGERGDPGKSSHSNRGYSLGLLSKDNPRVARILDKTEDQEYEGL